jgi:predicted HNH restriction endonuclease
MATIILLCNENYALTVRRDIESARRQLANGELSGLVWSVGKQQSVKVGDRIYIQRTYTYPPAGYFAAGRVIPTHPDQQLKLTSKKYADFDECYSNKPFGGKYLVEVLIDSVVDYDLPLELDSLKQKNEFEGADFRVQEGCAFDAKYAAALDKVWEKYLDSAIQGVSVFTALNKKGYAHMQQEDFYAAFEVYEKALEVAESIGDSSWINFFDNKKQKCWEELQKQTSPTIEKLVETFPEIFPDEVDSSEVFLEGAVRQVSINAYERDPGARKKCIEHYGTNCFVCGFNFGREFGKLGEGFIHVHHLKPLSEIGEEYKVNPIEDMRPVCPNCHAMLHRHSPPLNIEEVKASLSQSKLAET